MFLFEVKTPKRNVADVSFSFKPNSTGAITSLYGEASAVSWSSAGSCYVVTLKNPIAEVIAAIPAIQLATAADLTPQVGSCTSNTVVVRMVDSAGAGQNVASHANNIIHVALTGRTTTA